MGLSEVTRREGIPLLTYSPLGFGHLSAKYLNGAKPAGARLTRFPPFGQRYDKPNVMPAVAAYADLGEEGKFDPRHHGSRFRAQPLVLREHYHWRNHFGSAAGRHPHRRGYLAGRRSRGNRYHSPALPQSGNLNA